MALGLDDPGRFGVDQRLMEDAIIGRTRSPLSSL